ncbi:hypothetical protein BDR26DRAFT_860980 [Obelidium mucronatum]|nr:hypothetical protein BDR26DRAFT_860980 [Obelidium mucronatum]
MDLDVDTILPGILDGTLSPPKIRTALMMMYNKIPSGDLSELLVLLKQAQVLLESLSSDDQKRGEWMLDSLAFPLRGILTASCFLESTEPESGLLMAQLLDLLYKSVLTKPLTDIFINHDVQFNFGFILMMSFNSVCWKTWIKENPIDQEFVEKWLKLTTDYDFESAFRRMVEGSKVELSETLAARLQKSAFDQSVNEKQYDIHTSLDQVLNHSLSPQVRRRAFQAFADVLEKANDYSSSKKQKEAAALLIQEFNLMGNALIQDKDFLFLEDILFKVSQALQSRIYIANLPNERYDWAADALISLCERFKTGDKSFFDHMAPMAPIDSLVKGLFGRASDRTFEVYDALFEAIDYFDTEALPVVFGMGIYQTGGDGVKKAIIKHLKKVLEFSKKGDTSVGMIPVMLLQSDKDAFLPFVDDVFEIPNLAGAFLAAYRTDTTVFADKIPKLLPLLSDQLWGTTAAMVIEGTIVAHTDAFSEEASLLPVVEAFTVNRAKLGDKDAVSWYLIRVLSSVTTSETGALIGTTAIIQLIVSLLDASPRHPQAGEAIQQLLVPLASVASFNAEILKPHENVLTRIEQDSVIKYAGLQENLDNVLNALEGISLRKLDEKFKNSMKTLGIDPDDPFFEAVEETLRKEHVQEFDCMLSYCWAQQPIVLRIRDSLQERGFTCWLDLEQMSENVYVRMSEAVIGSKVIVACLSKAYEESGNCKRELGFAADQTRSGKKIVPLRFDEGSYAFTWTALITSGLLYTFIGKSQLNEEAAWESAMDGLAKEISAHVGPRTRKSEVKADDPKEEDKKFETAVLASKKKTDIPKFDAMLSYDWSYQPTVIRMKESLTTRGLSIWLDIERMSGNIYERMSDAVLGSSVIVSCMSLKYESSGNCTRELNFANSKVPFGKIIIPAPMEDSAFTWTNDITKGLKRYPIYDNVKNNPEEWEKAMDALADGIKAAIAKQKRDVSAKESSVSEVPPSVTASITKGVIEPAASAAPLSSDERALLTALQSRVKALESTVESQKASLEKQAAILRNLVDFIGLQFEE